MWQGYQQKIQAQEGLQTAWTQAVRVFGCLTSGCICILYGQLLKDFSRKIILKFTNLFVLHLKTVKTVLLSFDIPVFQSSFQELYFPSSVRPVLA